MSSAKANASSTTKIRRIKREGRSQWWQSPVHRRTLDLAHDRLGRADRGPQDPRRKHRRNSRKRSLEKSKLIGTQLNEFRYKNEELERVKELLATYVEKIKDMDLMPKVGQRTLKKLDMPPMKLLSTALRFRSYLLGGAAVGFILLSGLAVLMDLADRSYRNPSEISSDLNVSVLGHIPVMDISKVKKSIEGVDPSVCSIHHSKGRVSEAYRTIRTGLYFSNRGKALKVIQVTSPVPGDGKSTLSSNMAVTMAQSGRRVLLIDADLRRPRVAKIFGIDSEIGVAAVVSGKVEVDDAILAGPVPNLSILPGGKRPSNPAEILSSERFKNMVDMLRDKFDVIIIDTPPLLAVSDPGAVAGIVDGVVLTMRLRRNVKPLAARAKSILGSGRCQPARCRHQRRLIRSRLRLQLRLQRLPLCLQVR